MKQENRGGKRENAGRPKKNIQKKSVSFRLTEEEERLMRGHLIVLRKLHKPV